MAKVVRHLPPEQALEEVEQPPQEAEVLVPPVREKEVEEQPEALLPQAAAQGPQPVPKRRC